MQMFRMTRNEPYQNPTCPGYRNNSARQGYYIEAQSEDDAHAQMRERFPNDKLGFISRYWKMGRDKRSECL